MIRRLILLFSFFVSCISAPLLAQGINADSVKYVSPSYSNSSHLYSTIQRAIDESGAGTLVKVFPGNYNESITLKDSVNLYLAAGVKISNTGNVLKLNSSSHYNVSITGSGIIECTGGTTDAVYLQSISNGSNSNIYLECSEIRSTNGTAVNVQFNASNSMFNIVCSKVYAMNSGVIAYLYNTSNVLNFSCDSMTTLNDSNKYYSIYTKTGSYNFKVSYLFGDWTLLRDHNGVMKYSGFLMRNSDGTQGHCVYADSLANLICKVTKISNTATSALFPAIELETSSYLNLIVQDTIFSPARCVAGEGSCTINLTAGYIINTRGSGDYYTLYVNSQGYINAIEVRNMSDAVVVWTSPGAGLLTLSAKFVGNCSSRGIITVDTDLLVLKDCVIYNSGTGNGVGVESGVTEKKVRIYGTLFTNVPRSPSVNYITGSETNDFYVR